MYKSNLILGLLVSSILAAPSMANAVDVAPAAVEALDTAPALSPAGEEPPKKLKSVKELFKPSKSLTPKAPETIPSQPEPTNVDSKENVAAPALPQTNNQMPTQPMAPTTSMTGLPNEATLRAVKEPEDLSNLPGFEEPTEMPEDTETKDGDTKAKKKISVFEANMEGRSIMFNQKNILSVMRVLSAYIESSSNKADPESAKVSKKSLEELQQELLAKLKPEELVKGKKDIVTVRLPAYVKVDSILFRSPTNKQVWINKRKFAEGENNGELTIKSIEKEQVHVELSTKDTNVDLEKLKLRLKKSKDANAIFIDVEKKIIGFRLSTNQYIDLEQLKIKEGTFNTANSSMANKASHYYDPLKPEDRFVPLEDAEKAAEEAQSSTAEALASDEEPSKDPDTKIQTIDLNASSGDEIDSDEKPEETKAGEDKSSSTITLTPNKDDPNYEQFKQTAKDVLSSGKVSESDKAMMESIAAGDDEIETPAKKQ